ncbi:trimeric intracellular cation channel family protein [Propionibacteriaceae bacterium Y1685]
MSITAAVVLVLDLLGTFVFALNGALTALRSARLDVVGVITLGMITAVGGGVIRDVLIGDLPPLTFRSWPHLTVALIAATLAAVLGHQARRLHRPILVLDAAGLALFAVTGASRAYEAGLGMLPCLLLGVVTAVGGGVIRDVLAQQVPTVLHSELYAIPALLAAAIVIIGAEFDVGGPVVPVVAALICFGIRIAALRWKWNAPGPRTPGPRTAT